MDTDKQTKSSSMSTGTALLSTSGITALLIQLLPLVINDQDISNAAAPFIAGIAVYLFGGLLNKYGFESPELASTRRALRKNLKEIDANLKSIHAQEDPETLKMLRESRRKTLELLTNLGQADIIKSTLSSSKVTL